MDSNAPKIFLVDDDELSRRMMGLLLSEKGYNYDTASNGIEAVEAVQSNSYGIVLMDIQMPLMDGFEATKKIREWEEQNQHVPIVALTAMLLDDEIQRCMSAGMDDCIAKPFNTEILFQLISAYVSGSGGSDGLTGLHKTAVADKLEVLDIQEALPRFSGDIEFYRDFLNEFIENLPERVKQLRMAFLSGSLKVLADRAHNLKGISASMGAKQIAYLSQVLDQKSQDGDLAMTKGALEELEQHIHLFQDEAMVILAGYIGQQES